jgi:Tfp pilus assembly protein FimT
MEKESWFTLVELLIVLAVIAILHRAPVALACVRMR